MSWFYFTLAAVQSAGLTFSVVGYRRRPPGALRTSFAISTLLWAALLAWTFYSALGGKP